MTRCVEIHHLVCCILHLENRTAESVVYQALNVGINATPSGAQRDKLLKDIEDIMNKDAFKQGQWSIPMEKGVL